MERRHGVSAGAWPGRPGKPFQGAQRSALSVGRSGLQSSAGSGAGSLVSAAEAAARPWTAIHRRSRAGGRTVALGDQSAGGTVEQSGAGRSHRRSAGPTLQTTVADRKITRPYPSGKAGVASDFADAGAAHRRSAARPWGPPPNPAGRRTPSDNGWDRSARQ